MLVSIISLIVITLSHILIQNYVIENFESKSLGFLGAKT